MKRIGMLAATLVALAFAADPGSVQAAGSGYDLGVQTHFSQGWGPQWRDAVKSVGARHVRDGLSWGAVESRRGQYQFNAQTAGHLEWFRKQGIDVILTINPWNPAYDGGAFVQSEAGRLAFASYLDAILSRYGDVVYGIEVGNELNTKGGMRGVQDPAKAATYAGLLKTIYPVVKAKHPKVLIIGASTNVIGTGLIADIFRAGAGPYMDAVAVHPYRSLPETVDVEIAHLQAVLRPLGGPKLILASEFGDSFERASDAPAFMLKMVCLLSAGATRSYWYTLQDEPWFKNQGLFETTGREKPAAAAFRLLERELAQGPPARVDAGDPRTFVFKLGSDTYAIWGAQRPLSITKGAEVRDAEGRPVPAPDSVSMTPILVKGRASFSLGQPRVVADSLLDYGGPQWRYFAETPDGKLNALQMTDWTWTSYYGGKYFKPLRINADSLALAGPKDRLLSTVSRFTADKAQRVRILAAVSHDRKDGDGVNVIVRQNGSIIAQRHVRAEAARIEAQASLAAGDRIDFVVSPGADSSGDVVKQRFQLLAADGEGRRQP